MNEEIFDVVIQTTGRFRADFQTFQKNRPTETDFLLCDDFWVGSLPRHVGSEIVMDACDPAGFKHRPTRQYGAHYAFCHKVTQTQESFYEWDSDGLMGRTIFLSRLIWPTTIANSYSAKLYFRAGELKNIVPGPTQTIGSLAWVVAKDNWRDWLSVAELDQLRSLLPIYQVNPSDRIRRARRHLDNAFHAYYLDQRFASLVTSFESLLKLSDYKSTKQFATRTPKLAEMVGYELTSKDAEIMYRNRSAFVHGDKVDFEQLSDDLIEHYCRFERVIRSTLLRASTEPLFAELFSSPDSIKNAFGE